MRKSQKAPQKDRLSLVRHRVEQVEDEMLLKMAHGGIFNPDPGPSECSTENCTVV